MAVNNAISSGLRVADLGLQNVQKNIARINDPNASRVISATESRISANGHFLGVQMQNPRRVENALLAESIREQSVTASTSATISAAHGRILQHLGQVGDQGSLGYKLTDFKNALGLLEVTPGESGYQRATVEKLSSVLDRMNRFGTFCQSERERAEAGVANGVTEVNRILEDLHKVNLNLRSSAMGSPYSQDEQDKYLKELATYINVQVIRNENDSSVQIVSESGKPLLLQNGPVPIEFTAAPAVLASHGVNDLGKLTVGGQNLTEDIFGGSIGAHLKVRDSILPALQSDMDELAFQLKNHLNAIHNQGSGFPPPQVLEGTTVIADPANTNIEMSGMIRIGIIDRSVANQGAYAVAPFDFNFTAVTSVNNVVTALNGAFAGAATAVITPDGTLKITANNPTVNDDFGISIVSLSDPEAVDRTTNKGFSHFFGLNDLIVSGEDKIGMAQTVAVRSDIEAKPQLFSRGELSKGPAVLGDQGLYVGGNSAITKMMTAFEERVAFADSGNLSARRETLTVYANSIYHAEIMDARSEQAAAEVDAKVLQKKEKQHKNETGISLHNEIKDSMDLSLMSNALTQVSLAHRKMVDNLVNSL